MKDDDNIDHRPMHQLWSKIAYSNDGCKHVGRILWADRCAIEDCTVHTCLYLVLLHISKLRGRGRHDEIFVLMRFLSCGDFSKSSFRAGGS